MEERYSSDALFAGPRIVYDELNKQDPADLADLIRLCK